MGPKNGHMARKIWNEYENPYGIDPFEKEDFKLLLKQWKMKVMKKWNKIIVLEMIKIAIDWKKFVKQEGIFHTLKWRAFNVDDNDIQITKNIWKVEIKIWPHVYNELQHKKQLLEKIEKLLPQKKWKYTSKNWKTTHIDLYLIRKRTLSFFWWIHKMEQLEKNSKLKNFFCGMVSRKITNVEIFLHLILLKRCFFIIFHIVQLLIIIKIDLFCSMVYIILIIIIRTYIYI